MQKQFHNDFIKFQSKIAQFRQNTHFDARLNEYEELMNQMMSVSPDDMREFAEKSPTFLDARNRSLAAMERILEIHQELNALFKMDESTLAAHCHNDLASVDAQIAKNIQESAMLLKQYEHYSDVGRKALEQLNSPFFSQTL
jgi:hypothetical protein